MTRLLVLLLVAGLGAGAARAQGLSVEIMQRGEYVAEPGGPPDTDLKADTLSGVQTVARPRFVHEGEQVEGRACASFGIMFRVLGIPPGRTAVLTVRNSHPRMVRPDGVAGWEDTYEVRVGQDPSWVGFTFVYGWELVPGAWAITLSYGGRDLAQQRFEVRRAGDAGASDETCGAAVS